MMNKNIKDVYDYIRSEFKTYITEHNLKSVVLGISGGIDSAILAALFSDICKESNVNLIGRSITIESNKEDEISRSKLIGEAFCTNFDYVDLSIVYKMMTSCGMDEVHGCESIYEYDNRYAKAIRMGNFKARMRMMYLYNLAQFYSGMVLDTDNKTEHNLGFWTLHGDVGDYTPLIDLWKTEVYALSEYTLSQLKHQHQKDALMACIDAVPTDGLGITSSDVEQLGCSNYNEVDTILKICANNSELLNTLIHKQDDVQYKLLNSGLFDELIYQCGNENEKLEMLDKISKITIRHINSSFKRNNPNHIFLPQNI